MKEEKGKSEKEAFERFRYILKKLEGFEIDDIMSYLSMFVELRTGPKSDRNPLALIGGMSERENENFGHPNEEDRKWVNEWQEEFGKQVESEGEEKRAVELSPFFVYLRRLKVFDEWELAEMKPAFIRWLIDKYYDFDLRIEEGDLVVANGDIALGAFSQAFDNWGIVREFVEWFQSTQDELEGFGRELGLDEAKQVGRSNGPTKGLPAKEKMILLGYLGFFDSAPFGEEKGLGKQRKALTKILGVSETEVRKHYDTNNRRFWKNLRVSNHLELFEYLRDEWKVGPLAERK